MENNETDIDLKTDNKYVCENAVELQKCLKNVVKKILTKISEDEFVQIYKNCYKEFEKKIEIEKPALSGSSTEAKKYYSQFNSMVVKSIFVAIDQTVLGINQKLKELEDLKKNFESNDAVWRPPGNAVQHMMPFEYLSEVEKKKEMQKEIKIEKEALNVLKTRIIQKRTKALDCHQKLLTSMSNIENLVNNKNKDKEPKINSA